VELVSAIGWCGRGSRARRQLRSRAALLRAGRDNRKASAAYAQRICARTAVPPPPRAHHGQPPADRLDSLLECRPPRHRRAGVGRSRARDGSPVGHARRGPPAGPTSPARRGRAGDSARSGRAVSPSAAASPPRAWATIRFASSGSRGSFACASPSDIATDTNRCCVPSCRSRSILLRTASAALVIPRQQTAGARVSARAGTDNDEMLVDACRAMGSYEPDIRHRAENASVIMGLVAAGAVAIVPSLPWRNVSGAVGALSNGRDWSARSSAALVSVSARRSTIQALRAALREAWEELLPLRTARPGHARADRATAAGASRRESARRSGPGH
jgi:hypothetical protein